MPRLGRYVAAAFLTAALVGAGAKAQAPFGKSYVHGLDAVPSFTPSSRRDGHGDPLPLHAIARFGSCRLRHDQAVGLLFSPDGKILVSVGERDLRVWDVRSGKESPWLLQGSSATDRIDQVFFADGSLYTRLSNGQMQRWEVETGRLIDEGKAIAAGAAGKLEATVSSSDGKLHAALDAGMIRIKRTDGDRLHALDGHDAAITGLAISADGKRLASVDGDGAILTWNVGKAEVEHRWRAGGAACIALAADGRWLAIGGSGIRIYEAASGREIAHLNAHGNLVFAMAFAPDGKRLLSAGGDNRARLWDTDGWKEIRQFAPRKPRDPERTSRPWAVLFSADGMTMAVCAGDDEETNLWHVDAAREPTRIPRHWPIAFMPDGKSILTQNHFGHLSQRDTASGKEFAYSRALGWLASPDGARLLARGPDRRELFVRDWALDETLLGLHGERGAIEAGVFSGDGRWLFTASSLGTIVQWDVANSLRNARLERHWSMLLAANEDNAATAAAALLVKPDESIAFLKERVHPVGSKDVSIKQLIADLDHVRYPVRYEASLQIEKLGALAEPELKAALQKPPSLEFTRRAEALLVKAGAAKAQLPEQRATLRVIAIMERLATPEASEVLRKLASGYSEAPTTRAAQQALERLAGSNGKNKK